MEKNSLVLYYDMRQPLEELTNAQRGRLLMAILDYAQTGLVPDFKGSLQIAFTFIRAAIDRDAAKWEQTVEKRRRAGQMGGLAKAAKYAQANAENAEHQLANMADSVPVPVPESEPDSGQDSVSDSEPVPVSVGRPETAATTAKC